MIEIYGLCKSTQQNLSCHRYFILSLHYIIQYLFKQWNISVTHGIKIHWRKQFSINLVSRWNIGWIKQDIEWYCMRFNVYFIQMTGTPRLDFKTEICQELVELLCLFYILFLGHNSVYCIHVSYQQCPDQIFATILLTLISKSCWNYVREFFSSQGSKTIKVLWQLQTLWCNILESKHCT